MTSMSDSCCGLSRVVKSSFQPACADGKSILRLEHEGLSVRQNRGSGFPERVAQVLLGLRIVSCLHSFGDTNLLANSLVSLPWLQPSPSSRSGPQRGLVNPGRLRHGPFYDRGRAPGPQRFDDLPALTTD